MTLAEVAVYLKVSEKTVLRMVQSGQFPGVKVSNQWRFMRAVVDDWLSSRMNTPPRDGLADDVGTAARVIPMTRLVTERRILLNLEPGDRRHVLSQLVAPLVDSGFVPDAQRYVDHLVAREELVSTAIGRGLALPHIRDPQDAPVEHPCIVLGICPDGTDFGGLDGRPTTVFAMPCAPSEVAHLRLLARLSLVFRQTGVLDRLRDATTPADVLTVLAEADRDLIPDAPQEAPLT